LVGVADSVGVGVGYSVADPVGVGVGVGVGELGEYLLVGTVSVRGE
jgi:hypothetical protein